MGKGECAGARTVSWVGLRCENISREGKEGMHGYYN